MDAYHFQEYIAYLLIKKNPIYPCPIHYGAKLSKSEILKGWEQSGRAVRKGLAPGTLDVHIDIPFCRSNCYFCQCPGIKTKDESGSIASYLKTVYEEMAVFAPAAARLRVTSVFFGGGTPSLMTPGQIQETHEVLKKNFRLSRQTRIIFEASPFTLDFPKLDMLKKIGVHEIDLGIQSFDDDLLKKNHRPQKTAQVTEIVRYAKKIGIPAVSCDLMAGLPYETHDSILKTLAVVSCLPIDAVYINPFIPNKHTAFHRDGNSYPPEKIAERNRVSIIMDKFLKTIGYNNTAFELRKKWKPQDGTWSFLPQEITNLMGFGHSALSRIVGSFRYTQFLEDLLPLETNKLYGDLHLSRLGHQAKNTGKGASFIYRGIRMNKQKEMNAFAYAHLAQLSFAEFQARFRCDFQKTFKKQLGQLVRHGDIRVEGDKITVLKDDPASRKVIYSFFIHKEHVRKIMGSDTEKYDPDKNYRSLIAPFAA